MFTVSLEDNGIRFASLNVDRFPQLLIFMSLHYLLHPATRNCKVFKGFPGILNTTAKLSLQNYDFFFLFLCICKQKDSR